MSIKRKIEKTLSGGLELPPEIISDLPKLTVTGNSFLKVENYKSLVEYETNVIRINTSRGLICIEGKGLGINSVTDEMIEISGEIEKTSYE